MADKKYMIGELEEDYDLLTYDREPTVVEEKVANDILKVIALLKEQEGTIDNLLSQIGKQAGMLEDRNSTEQKCMENIVHMYDNYYVGTCPTCGKGFSTNGGTAIFCKYCGQAVKWDV